MKLFVTFAVAATAACCLADGSACCKKDAPAKDAFLVEAEKMMLAAEGKTACCKSTPAKVVVKGESGCCNAPGAAKPFKVFVAGEGYKFFGCAGSAAKGRKELVAKGSKVGAIQKATK